MTHSHADAPSQRNQHPAEDDSAAAAGSESPEEGQAAMDAAEDAVIDSGDNN